MNYKKIVDTIEKRNLKIKPFFESLGFSSSYIYKVLEAESIKVKDLELISKELNLPMSYWFEDKKDEKHEVNEQTVEYIRLTKTTVEELQIDLKYFRERCVELDEENRKLKSENPGNEISCIKENR